MTLSDGLHPERDPRHYYYYYYNFRRPRGKDADLIEDHSPPPAHPWVKILVSDCSACLVALLKEMLAVRRASTKRALFGFGHD
jgi:hypothetical protein